MPLQSAKPELHDAIVQTPNVQLIDALGTALQLLPQEPQFPRSVSTFVAQLVLLQVSYG